MAWLTHWDLWVSDPKSRRWLVRLQYWSSTGCRVIVKDALKVFMTASWFVVWCESPLWCLRMPFKTYTPLKCLTDNGQEWCNLLSIKMFLNGNPLWLLISTVSSITYLISDLYMLLTLPEVSIACGNVMGQAGCVCVKETVSQLLFSAIWSSF